MRRALLLLIALAVSPAAPAAARGGSLLSGYGGPGQGEQVLLGTQLFGGSGSRPAAPRRATSPASIAVTPAGSPPPAAASGGTPTRSRSRGRRSSSKSGGRDRAGSSGALSGGSRSGSPGAGDPATSPPPAAPGDRRPGSAGLPLDATQGVVALLLALGLITIALATPRLARRA